MTELEKYPDHGTLEEQIDWFSRVDLETLLDREKLGRVFNEVTEPFSEIQTFLARLDPSAVAKVTSRLPWDMPGHLLGVKVTIANIIDFSRSPMEMDNIGQTWGVNLRNYLKEMVDVLTPHSLLVLKQLPDEEIKTAVDAARRYSKECEQSRDEAAEIAGQMGVRDKADYFSEAAGAHQCRARAWLAAAIFGGLFLIWAAGSNFEGLTLPDGRFDWGGFVPRFAFFGLLVFFEVVLIGNYKAERHNSIVNKHRANALDSFEIIHKAAVAQEAKDTILQTAAGAIYAPQETGFRAGGAAQTHGPREILATITQGQHD